MGFEGGSLGLCNLCDDPVVLMHFELIIAIVVAMVAAIMELECRVSRQREHRGTWHVY